MHRLLFSLCAASVFVLGCGPRVPTSPTVNLQAGAAAVLPDNSDRGEILVWATKTDGGQTRTFRLSAEGSLNVLGEMDGIHIATTRGELTWEAKEKQIKLAGCDEFDGTPPGERKGTITNGSLLNGTGEVVQKIVDSAYSDGSEVNDLQHHVALLGTIGPYLFIHEQSYMYACGAHGNETASALVWDAESGKTINLWTELPGTDKLAEDAQKILNEREHVDAGDQDESSKPEPAQFIPVYSEHGALGLDAQFTRWACYACSDGQWSSYTVSAVVSTNWMPERMRPWVTPPVVVKEFLQSRRDWQLGGWSKR